MTWWSDGGRAPAAALAERAPTEGWLEFFQTRSHGGRPPSAPSARAARRALPLAKPLGLYMHRLTPRELRRSPWRRQALEVTTWLRARLAMLVEALEADRCLHGRDETCARCEALEGDDEDA